MQALLFRRFFFAVHHQEDLSFCKKEVLKKLCLKLKKRIRFAINCKSDPFFFVCKTIACYDGNYQK